MKKTQEALLGSCGSQVGMRYSVLFLYNHLFWLLAPLACWVQTDSTYCCPRTSDWLWGSPLAEKSYVHQVGSTKEAAASSRLPLAMPFPPFHPEEATGQQSCWPGLSLSPSLEAGVWPHRGRQGADEKEAGFPSASWMFSRQPRRSMSQSTCPSTSSVASWRGVRRRQASSMLY